MRAKKNKRFCSEAGVPEAEIFFCLYNLLTHLSTKPTKEIFTEQLYLFWRVYPGPAEWFHKNEDYCRCNSPHNYIIFGAMDCGIVQQQIPAEWISLEWCFIWSMSRSIDLSICLSATPVKSWVCIFCDHLPSEGDHEVAPFEIQRVR